MNGSQTAYADTEQNVNAAQCKHLLKHVLRQQNKTVCARTQRRRRAAEQSRAVAVHIAARKG